MANRPLILLTNDDGIESPGLHAAAEAVVDLGDLLVIAPSSQRTGAGRSYPPVIDKAIYPAEIPLNGTPHPAYKVDVSPAQAVLLAITELAEVPIDLCLSGINYGENVGSGVTISGTVGAAIEAACFGIPALALSFETPKEFHREPTDEINFGVAAHFTRHFAQQVLCKGLPAGVDLLKIDIPATATAQTPWRAASISRQRYFQPTSKHSHRLHGLKEMDYQAHVDHDTLELGSDVHIFAVEKLVSVVPMTIDMTAPIALMELAAFFNGPSEKGCAELKPR